jgi:hypothetical protein
MLRFESLSTREMLANNVFADMLSELSLVDKGTMNPPAQVETRTHNGALLNVGGQNTWLAFSDPDNVDAAMSGFFNGRHLTARDLTREQSSVSPSVTGLRTSVANDPIDPQGRMRIGTESGIW